jgi:hypothetical protein
MPIHGLWGGKGPPSNMHGGSGSDVKSQLFGTTMFEDFQHLPPSMDWFVGENLNRKPSIFQLNMGLSCKFSLKPIHWHTDFGVDLYLILVQLSIRNGPPFLGSIDTFLTKPAMVMNSANCMVQYLHFRILKFPLIFCHLQDVEKRERTCLSCLSTTRLGMVGCGEQVFVNAQQLPVYMQI